MGEFQPKGAEVLQQEILAELNVSYEGNEEMIDKMVARELKGEEFKASVHEQKKEHQARSQKREELLKNLGVNPETGEKLQTNVVDPKKADGLTAKDVVALRDVHEEDVDYLLEEAKLRGKSVSELKADPYMKIILKTKAEERKTAEATQTKQTGRTSTNKNNVEKIMENFEQGIVPDDPEEFAKAQHAYQKAQKR